MATERIMSRSSSSCSDVGSLQEELDNGTKIMDKQKMDNNSITKSISTAILNNNNSIKNNKNNNKNVDNVNDNNSKNKSKDVGLKKKLKSSKKTGRRDPERFLGEGVNFKAKLIGSHDVPQPRGEKMAQEALQELKAQKKVSGEHKRRIVINISLDGLRIREEKKKEVLYFHAVHKISFISQDATDNRAFGYIYGSPDNVHTFFAIKTEKLAHQIVMCMRDLFQIAFELKKREIEQWRQQQLLSSDSKSHGQSTSLGTDSNDGSTVSGSSQRDSSSPTSMDFPNPNGLGSPFGPSPFDEGGSVLVDFSIPANRTQRELLAAAFDVETFGPNADTFFDDPWEYMRTLPAGDDVVEDSVDPFGLESPPVTQPIVPTTPIDDPFNTSFVHVPFAASTSTPCIPVPIQSPNVLLIVTDDCSNVAVTTEVDKYAALAEISTEVSMPTTATIDEAVVESSFNELFDGSVHEANVRALQQQQQQQQQQPDVSSIFSDLDPLGKDRPYVDKKDFFYDVKNPPKKVLKDLIAENTFPLPDFNVTAAGGRGDSSTEEVEITSPSPTLPPPLPPPFVRRARVASPIFNVQCNVDGQAVEVPRPNSRSSLSTSSSSFSVPEVYLPPPPPPPPRPLQQHSTTPNNNNNNSNHNVLTSPCFTSSVMKTGCRDSVYSSSGSSDGSSSPTGDVPACNSSSSSSIINSTPPIPIPMTRRDFGGQPSSSSMSSSGVSSTHNSGSFEHNSSCGVERPFNKWNQLSSSNPTTPTAILSPPPQSNSSRKAIPTAEQMANWLSDSSNNNNDGHNLMPHRGLQLQRTNNRGANIFHKEEDPFNDDDFFSALRPNSNPFR